MKIHSSFELSYTQPSSDWKSHTLAHTQRHTYGGYLSLRKFRGVTGSGIAVRCGYDGVARRLTDAAFWYPVNVGDVAKLHTLNYVHSFCSVCVCVCIYLNCWPKERGKGRRRSKRRHLMARNKWQSSNEVNSISSQAAKECSCPSHGQSK